jgi:GH15 family glucan-1,4-alpha-glucosidase
MRTLDLAIVGNGAIGLLVDPAAAIVWGCFPRLDSDATFCALLDDAKPGAERGIFAIDLVDMARSEQSYATNSAVLVTRLFDNAGGTVEITDCVPRFLHNGRIFHPMMLVRRIRRIAGSPRITIRLRPAVAYGSEVPVVTSGSSHLRFVMPDVTLRLTTDASLTAIREERSFFLDDTVTLLLGPDETVQSAVAEVGRRFIENTDAYWRDWVRRLAIPFEWQDAVIRAAITLQQNAYDDTGAIVAALTTSIPEAANSGRNWDYRFCWLRDGYFVVDALNRLGATDTMERYLGYFVNIAAGAVDGPLQPVYQINGGAGLAESVVDALPGYRGMGPVRVGNDACRQVQHDVYGSAILAATHVFFDERLIRRGDVALFERLEPLGRRALAVYTEPDAGLWERRTDAQVHTFSVAMCWAACDRLARIAARVGLPERAHAWRNHALGIAHFVDEHCFNAQRRTFVATVDGSTLDASLLLLQEIGLVTADDPRFVATVAAIERELKRGDFVFRYVDADDFGVPENAFVVCTFWYVNALAALGRRDEAREIFARLLTCRNRHGLLAEHIAPNTREPWGNFVQTYSMVGLITSAIRLSIPWSEAF